MPRTSRLRRPWGQRSQPDACADRLELAEVEDVQGRAAAVAAAYRSELGREPDPAGLALHSEFLAAGGTYEELVDRFRSSPEYAQLTVHREALEAMHRARQAWIRGLPAARRIVDLGGSSTTNAMGALVEMGYRHDFDRLVIVDLPQDLRHELYVTGFAGETHRTERGDVQFLYRSMTDLSTIEDASIDLVCSGQSFEHVTRDEGHVVLDEARRVLRPGGVLALDTPNRRVTALQLRDAPVEFINPDHKVEYHHHEMMELFAQHDFDVLQAIGLNHVPTSVREDRFDLRELVASTLVSDDIESCYMLAYLVARDRADRPGTGRTASLGVAHQRSNRGGLLDATSGPDPA